MQLVPLRFVFRKESDDHRQEPVPIPALFLLTNSLRTRLISKELPGDRQLTELRHRIRRTRQKWARLRRRTAAERFRSREQHRAEPCTALHNLFTHLGDCMESGQNASGSLSPVARYDVGHVQEVIQQAHEELRLLLQQRAEVMKRIGTVKQTISGLANLFGDGVLNEELMELVDRKSSGRQPGFTKACRMILMEAGRALNSRDICDHFQQKMPALLARHKDPMASVTTVLNRLVEYGEAEAVMLNGRRAWRWVADVPMQSEANGSGGSLGSVVTFNRASA